MSYVNQDSTGWTELRVHGVSGTTPENLLEHPHTARVAGGTDAGFYRRSWESPLTSGDTDQERLEAYSWGGLTAGSGQRAFWLLLAPFMLVNVGYWAVPYADQDDAGGRRAVRRTSEAIQRLFALSITLALVLAFVAAAMNFVGWQCAAPTDTCSAKYSWLRFLSWSWIDLPGRRLVVTALLPLAAVGMLWWLANKSWAQSENQPVPAAPGVHETPLENRSMWNGRNPVRRLRAVHIAAGFAFVAVFLLAPFAGTRARELGRGPAVLLLLVLAMLVLTAVLACLPGMSDRDTPGDAAPSRTDRWLYRWVPWLPWATLGLVVAAGAVAWLQTSRTTDLVGGTDRTSLPALSGVVDVLGIAQLTSWVVMLVLLLVMRRFAQPTADPTATAPARAVHTAPAWYGLATVALMLLGSALAAAYAAGIVLAVAHGIGRPAARPVSPDAFVVPMAYFWAAALAFLAAVVAALLAGTAMLWLRRGARSMLTNQVVAGYPAAKIAEALRVRDQATSAVVRRRAEAIARQWANAAITEVGRRLLGLYVIIIGVLIGAAVGGFAAAPDWIYVHARWAVNIGDLAVAGFALALLWVGRQAYRNPGLRRTVGVLWDIGTFWPRATHPLAPPSYAERAVPDLVRRIEKLTDDGWVLLSCHSQGTVIGAAVLMQLTYRHSGRVALITYGSPLRRLYARFFPAYLGAPALRRAGGFLVGDPEQQDRAVWPWRNLYRPSDPIGGAILIDYPATDVSDADWAAQPGVGDNRDVDRQLIDPRFGGGDSDVPRTYGHSGYPSDRTYRACVTLLRTLRSPAGVPAPPPPAPAPVPPAPAAAAAGSTTAAAVPTQPGPVHPWDEQVV